MTQRKPLFLLLLIVMFGLSVSACGTASRSVSTAQGTTSTTDAVSLAEDASPEQVRLAVAAALESLGPIRVEANVTADMAELANEGHVEQLLDPVRHLAKETVSRSQGSTQRTSVIGRETVRIMGEGAEAQVVRSVRLQLPTGLPLPLYGLSPKFPEDMEAVSASRQTDGSWELVLRPPLGAGQAPQGSEDVDELLLIVGPDLLPRRTERAIHYTTGGGTAGPEGPTSTWQKEETSVERVEYLIQPIAALSEDDVHLSLPENYRLVETYEELPPDRPRAGVNWSQYWLGPQFLDLKLQSATLIVSNPDEAERSEATTSVYGSSGQPPWDRSIQLFTHARKPGEPDDWEQMTEPPLPNDTTEKMTVAGRTATVHTRIVSAPVEAFAIWVVFPDVSVQIQAFGLPPEAAKNALEELREM